MNRNHPVPTQSGSETDHLDAGHGEFDHQHASALTSREDQNSESLLSTLDYPRPQPEAGAVELDDLLILERTELLLKHCVFTLFSVIKILD